MKKILSFLSLASLLVFPSCSDWLDVEPKSEIKAEIMYETEQGIKDALIGSYIKLSERPLYGENLTCTFLDVLAQQYTLLGSTSSSFERATHYIYTSYEGTISSIWLSMYNTIANVNALIEGLEGARSNIHPTIYALTKAEAYSLRAFMYFDLVRLFTWGNLPERQEVLGKLALPYPKVYNKHIVPQEKLENVLSFIHEDLETALDLFYLYDPLSKKGNRPEGYVLPNDDKFYDPDKRRYRMNLNAALAVRMRLNMWEGNYEKAKKDAKALTESGVSWVSNLDQDKELRDLTFSSEMLFGVQTHDRFEKVVKRFFKLTNADDLNTNYEALYLSSTRLDDLYEVKAGFGAADWRYVHLWDKSGKENCFVKFWEYKDMRHTENMPLIKWPEIYYTLAECALREGGDENKNKAVDYLNTVRNHRNLPASVNLSHNLKIEDVWKELHKEWRKEFIGDGQLFYYYKRNGFSSIPNGPALSYDDKVYVLPLPQEEVDTGSCEQLVDREKK